MAAPSREFTTQIPTELVNKLKEPLPKEAVAPHPTKSYLSTIKAIYVVERLNEVFGLGEWQVTNEFVERVEKMVIVKSALRIEKYGIRVEAFGGNDNADLGDAYKGACTDALTKMASYLYIGMDVFKGTDRAAIIKDYAQALNQPIHQPAVTHVTQTTPATQPAPRREMAIEVDPANAPTENQRKAIYAISKSQDQDAEAMAAKMFQKRIKELTKKEASLLIDRLKGN